MRNHGSILPSDWRLFQCDPTSGRERLVSWGSEAEGRVEMRRPCWQEKDIWLQGPDGTKVLPSDLGAADSPAPLERLLQAADNHAEDSGEPDHAIGDLQDLLRAAWALMTLEQRRALVASDAADAVIEAGARDEFDAAELLDSLS